jgi:hypothetical protein
VVQPQIVCPGLVTERNELVRYLHREAVIIENRLQDIQQSQKALNFMNVSEAEKALKIHENSWKCITVLETARGA